MNVRVSEPSASLLVASRGRGAHVQAWNGTSIRSGWRSSRRTMGDGAEKPSLSSPGRKRLKAARMNLARSEAAVQQLGAEIIAERQRADEAKGG